MSHRTDPSQATVRLLAFGMLKGVGPATLRKIAMVDGFERLRPDEIGRIFSAVEKALREDSAWKVANDAAERQVELSRDAGATVLSLADLNYPLQLRQTNDDPAILYVKGALSFDQPSVALIGTRKPTEHGIEITKRLAKYFVSEGWSVISGLALGCDAVAHQAALDTGGHTVAVLAHGLQTIAPSKNRQLAEDILSSGGALVSEFPFGVEPLPQYFVQRDKTQAGMAEGVVMVQSDIEGGSLHASRAALSYGRWLAVPYPTVQDRASGSEKIQANLLLADGSEAERADLLRVPVSRLNQVVILRTKKDYVKIFREDGVSVELPEVGPGLF